MALVDQLAELQEATRVRLAEPTVYALRKHLDMHEGCAEDEHDRRVVNGLSILLDMHDKLEAIRRG